MDRVREVERGGGRRERERVREEKSGRGRGGYLERDNLEKYVESEREGGRER